MAEVGIDFKDMAVVMFKHPCESGQVGAAESLFVGTVKHVNVNILCSDFLSQRTRAIRRVVIDNEYVGLRQAASYSLNKRRQISFFVVGGDDGNVNKIRY